MNTTIDFARLAEPFPAEDLEWRIGMAGGGDKPWAMVLTYITSRAVMDRLDEVVGAGNWQIRYEEFTGGVVAAIGIKIDDEWIWKSDGADKTATEPFKGMLSGSVKRAAVHWGIGRYLYKLDNSYAEISLTSQPGWNRQKESKGKYVTFWWKPKPLPTWALPPVKIELFSPAFDDEHLASLSEASYGGKDISALLRAEMTEKSIGSPKAIDWWITEYLKNIAGNMNEDQAVEATNKAYLLMVKK